MPPDRRYTEEEIAAIFQRAAAAQHAGDHHPSSTKGLTLSELQKIGAEAGISAEFVTRAAAEIGHRAGPDGDPETFFGLPTSASYSVDIPGPFTEEDWDRLVVDLRRTFQARGEISQDGSLREWRNGNLYALVEPRGEGVCLRMGTRKVEAKGILVAGAVWFLFWALIGIAKLAEMGFDPNVKIWFMSVVALIGLGVLGTVAAGLPKWSKKRQHQMEVIAKRTLTAETASTDQNSLEAKADVRFDQQARSAPVIEIPDAPESGSDVQEDSNRSRDRQRG